VRHFCTSDIGSTDFFNTNIEAIVTLCETNESSFWIRIIYGTSDIQGKKLDAVPV